MQQSLTHFLMQGRTVLWLLGAYLFMALVVMNYGANTINTLAGSEQTPLDLYFSYTPEQARTALNAFGEKGRAFYALFEMIADSVYPIVYTLFLCSLFGYAWKQEIVAKPHSSWLIFLPFTTFLFDIVENMCIVIMLKSYPTVSDSVITLGSYCTSLKWISAILVIAAIVIGLLKKLYTKFSTRTSA